ncbi:MAG: methyltransferase domain-containing protein [Chloroflexi bacterium]|nr:methyltransferase domain-containing protein [Chloroflexota bacterium]
MPDQPADPPFEDAHFKRVDESDDANFYVQPRLVTHIDDDAIGALREHYSKFLPKQGRLLDLMSSWVSHYPDDLESERVAGLGMNADELAENPQLTEWVVHDLNADPVLPYGDGEFDVVTIAVSVQYLTRPLEVFREIGRVLRPGGGCIVSFSNRCFPTKAVWLWQGMGDDGHVQMVGAYFHYSGAFDPPQWHDISPAKGQSDPMYVVQSRTPPSANAKE